jgi:3-oxoacyl-[acyl-carrier protein] reductase
MDYQAIQPRYSELKGRVALVTGAARGIGKGIALRLAREGMRVIINDRDKDAAEATAGELRSHGADVRAIIADLASTAEINRLVDQTVKELGTVDLLVNNAGLLPRGAMDRIEESFWDLEFAVNVKAPFLLSQRAAATMKKSGGGAIVHISSVGGLRAHFQGLPYNATKGAVDAMTRAMGIELAEQGIRVNSIAPGAIHTERRKPIDDPAVQAAAQLIPARRLGLPLEIGAVVAFLASDDSRYIIGQTIYVDGGITAQLSPSQYPV